MMKLWNCRSNASWLLFLRRCEPKRQLRPQSLAWQGKKFPAVVYKSVAMAALPSVPPTVVATKYELFSVMTLLALITPSAVVDKTIFFRRGSNCCYFGYIPCRGSELGVIPCRGCEGFFFSDWIRISNGLGRELLSRWYAQCTIRYTQLG